MTEILELPDQKFRITVINMPRTVMGKKWAVLKNKCVMKAERWKLRKN